MAYRLTHPKSKQEIEVPADRVSMYESQGWETAPTAKAPASEGEKSKGK